MQETVDGAETAEASFELIYGRLEQAVQRLEAGGLSLEESIATYERGMRLAQRCKEMLDAAELRVSELEREFAPEEPEELDELDESDYDGSEA